MNLTRRAFLGQFRHSLYVLGGGLATVALACSKADQSCVDPDLLSTPERGLRKSQGYVDRSPHGDAKSCRGCQFFTAETLADCGSCQILGGPVHASGHCSAWSRKLAPAAAEKGSA